MRMQLSSEEQQTFNLWVAGPIPAILTMFVPVISELPLCSDGGCYPPEINITFIKNFLRIHTVSFDKNKPWFNSQTKRTYYYYSGSQCVRRCFQVASTDVVGEILKCYILIRITFENLQNFKMQRWQPTEKVGTLLNLQKFWTGMQVVKAE